MSSPPQSPTTSHRSHRRNPSNISTSAQNSRRRSHHRQSSSYQDFSPIGSPVQPNFDGEHDGAAAGTGNGLGSLADELGEWDSDEDAVDEDTQIASETNESTFLVDRTKADGEGLRPEKAHRRNESMYDGSDYGDENDLEADEGISKGLERQMAEVESLARRGLEENGSANDGVVGRVTASLRDLGSQAGVESSATRLTTAHTALASHITHQTRTLTSLTSTLFSPLSPPMDPDTLAALIPLIDSTLPLIPTAPSTPLQNLTALSHSTAELLDTLSLLTDTLHMARQSQATAQRRLRGVRETLAEWKREGEAREEGIRYIEKGGWERRLKEREGKATCEGVVRGFEEKCEGWRRRLVEGSAA